MKKLWKIFILTFFLFNFHSLLLADLPRYLDFKYILNESTAGKKAQNFLKSKLDKGIKNLKAKENKLQEDEKKIIQQKKSSNQKNINQRSMT